MRQKLSISLSAMFQRAPTMEETWVRSELFDIKILNCSLWRKFEISYLECASIATGTLSSSSVMAILVLHTLQLRSKIQIPIPAAHRTRSRVHDLTFLGACLVAWPFLHVSIHNTLRLITFKGLYTPSRLHK